MNIPFKPVMSSLLFIAGVLGSTAAPAQAATAENHCSTVMCKVQAKEKCYGRTGSNYRKCVEAEYNACMSRCLGGQG